MGVVMATDQEEYALTLKLLLTLHLSVPERKILPDQCVRFSVIILAIKNQLEEQGWFPHHLKDGDLIGSGALLESRQNTIFVHEQFEIGAMRYSPVETRKVSNIVEAIKIFLSHNGETSIDGVKIDYES